MLDQNPKGGHKFRHGRIDYDSTYNGYQYKLGYCSHCHRKVLATPGQLDDLVNAYSYLVVQDNAFKRVAQNLLKKLA